MAASGGGGRCSEGWRISLSAGLWSFVSDVNPFRCNLLTQRLWPYHLGQEQSSSRWCRDILDRPTCVIQKVQELLWRPRPSRVDYQRVRPHQTNLQSHSRSERGICSRTFLYHSEKGEALFSTLVGILLLYFAHHSLLWSTGNFCLTDGRIPVHFYKNVPKQAR